MPRKHELEKYVDFQRMVLSVTRNKGWKVVETYIRAKMAEAEKAWHATKIEHLSNEKVVRALMDQRATVKVLKDLLSFVYSKEALKTAVSELDIISLMEQENPEE